MANINPFDTAPSGYQRGKKGWIVPAQTPQAAATKRVQKENKELKETLALLMEKVDALSPSEGKKKKQS